MVESIKPHCAGAATCWLLRFSANKQKVEMTRSRVKTATSRDPNERSFLLPVDPVVEFNNLLLNKLLSSAVVEFSGFLFSTS